MRHVVRQVAEEVVVEDVADAAEQVGVDALAGKNLVGVRAGAADLRGKPGDAAPLAEKNVVNVVADVHGVRVFLSGHPGPCRWGLGDGGYGKRGILTLPTSVVRPSHCLSSLSWQRRKPTPICTGPAGHVGRQEGIHTLHGTSSLQWLSE